jgi:CelD/BcsL family acetyltransferase involved in cellulose biosynthesis
MLTSGPIQVLMCEGGSALERMADPTFRRRWDSLHALCPWAKAFQTWTFADIWYSVYGRDYEPLLTYVEEEGGNLSGLFALAVHRRTGSLVPVGAHQAEYQVWLATPETGDRFIEAVLDRLAVRFPGGCLTLRWLPPEAPVGWLEAARPWAERTRFKAFSRPLMTVGAGNTLAASLKKKSNKQRLNRLRELGPIRLEIPRSRQEIEPIFDQFMAFCDFRNGARYKCLPFRDDPFKREFYLRLVDAPDITHASVLWAGDEFLAANIGGREVSSVQVGLITQSPFVSKYSPGKYHFLLLGQELGSSGFLDLDLTPSDDLLYKERFADHFDTVHTGTIFFRLRDARRHDLRLKTLSLLRDLLKCIGVTPDAIRTTVGRVSRRLRSRGPFSLVLQSVLGVSRRIWSRTQLNFYQMSPEDTSRMEVSTRFQRDSLRDLLLYEQPFPESRTKFDFIEDAFKRLEAGGHVLTLASGGRLLHCSWVSPVSGPTETELGSQLDVPPDSVMLWDDYTHPSIANDNLYRSSIITRLCEAGSMAHGEGRIFISIPARNHEACLAMDGVGFQPFANVTRSLRLGIKSWSWRFE